MSNFYITTPLYYVNSKPHLGTAYSTIISDVISRYQRYFGNDVLFLTGTDEHGQKIQQSAEKNNQSPIEYCNQVADMFKNVWQNLDINYDIFYRTTQPNHIKAVQNVLQTLFDKGEIYTADYDGWYSVSEEIFLTEKELVNGKSPAGNDVVKITEKNYFFKMSSYQEKLLAYIEAHPNFIMPQSRRNEVIGFLKKPMGDLCISRPKSRMSWGIEIPFDKDYVTYVWFDALLNYAVAVGLNERPNSPNFEKWWSHKHSGGANHIIGKDILTTHAVYWTTMLMAIGVDLPKTIFAHGWILNRSSEKMSKSKGDTFDPVQLTKEYGSDAIRYFVCRDIHFGNDAPFSAELLIQRVNTDLANNIGNMYSRVSQLIDKYFEGKAPGEIATDVTATELAKKTVLLGEQVKNKINNWEISHALEAIMSLLTEYNKYLEDKAPWKLAKEDKVSAGKVLHFALEGLRICSLHLQPVMPNKMQQLLSQMQCNNQVFNDTLKFNLIKEGTQIVKSQPIFPRLDVSANSQ